MSRIQLDALRGPATPKESGAGPFSLADTTLIRCHNALCKRRPRLAVVSGAAMFVALVSDLEYVGKGEHGAWCSRCKKVTVYRVVDEAA